MGNAKYVGRVGALAVALGIGTAVATTPWVAVAEPSTDSSSASDSSSSTAESTSTDDAKPAPAGDSSGGIDTAADSGISGGDPGSGIVASSGGAVTSSSSAGVAAHKGPGVSTEGDEAATQESLEPIVADPATDDPESSTPEQPLVPETPPPITEPATVSEPSDDDGPAPAQQVTVDPPQAHALAAVTDTADPDAGLDALEDAGAAHHATALSATSWSATAPASAVPAIAVATPLLPAAQAAPANPVAVVSDLVSGLLAWVGLGPSLNAPAAPVQSPGLLGLLAWIGHEIRRTFFNQTPTTAYNPAENSKTVDGDGSVTKVTGDLNAVDADGDPLVFTVTQTPQKGSVVVNPDGTFTYTPSAQLATTGGTDVFVVEVEDRGFHLHGLPGLLNLVTFGLLGDSSHGTTATVTLNVVSTNQPPQVGNPAVTIVNVDADTGVVTGKVNVTDGDSLVYSLSGVPNEGSFSVDTSGVWTYTPSLDARLRATDINAIPADKQVSFGITVSDGLTYISVPITAPVTPLAIATIAVGDGPVGVAVSPDGATAYVTNFGDDEVSVIDTATNTVIDTITVGDGPVHVAVSPNGDTVYVTNFTAGTVSVIDTDTDAVTTILVGNVAPEGVAVSPDGARVYVANRIAGTVSVIDTTTNMIGTITVGDSPARVTVSPDGETVYVVNIGDNTVSVIDTDTDMVTATIPVGVGPFGVAVSPDSANAYVTNASLNTVSVIDTATHTVIATIPVGFAPEGVAVSPDGARVYVANQFGGTVSAIDTATNTVTATIAVGDNPRGVAVSPDGTSVYVVNIGDGSVSVITLG
jgi:YVTN family beta-propeller protein/VCBS repeat-containing protein